MPLRSPHRVHAPCQHLRNVGLDILEDQFVTSQEAVEDARVIAEVSFLSQIQVEVLGIFFSCGAGRKKQKHVRWEERNGPLLRGSAQGVGTVGPCASSAAVLLSTYSLLSPSYLFPHLIRNW